MNRTLWKGDLLIPSVAHELRGRILQQLVNTGGIGAEIGVYRGQFTRTILNTVTPQRLHLIDP
jgi:hypothetical protein